MADPRLSILAFPQKIIGRELSFHVLIIPRNIDPLAPWADTGAPAWADADLQLRAMVINSLAKFPAEAPNANAYTLIQSGIPSAARSLFEHLKTRFQIVPAPAGSSRRLQKPGPADFARKYLPKSYRKAFNFTGPRTRDAVTDDSYQCAVKKNPKPNPLFTQSDNTVSWGKVFAYCLRQPALAEKLGFIHRLSVHLEEGIYENGGWLYIDLVPGSSYTQPADLLLLKKYAARIPALSGDRNLFAPVLFPVKENEADADPAGFDMLFAEAANFDDGFAKIVHAGQPVSTDLLKEEEEDDDDPPIHDIGLRLGWEDEQILIWINRQLRADPNDPSGEKRLDAPMGVFQYRVDVRQQNSAEWASLNLVRNKADLVLDPANPSTSFLEAANSLRELGVDVYPAKLDGDPGSHFWLPAYFANWIGKPLVLPDEDAAELYLTSEAGANLAKIYAPATEDGTTLTYGNQYQFRVRFSDPTGGGPGWENTPLNNPVYEGPSPEAACWFKRHVVPQPLVIEHERPQSDEYYFAEDSLRLKRPGLSYPSVVFTGKYGDAVIDLLKADRVEASSFIKDPVSGEIIKRNRDFSLPDPDVIAVEITVEVKALEMDIQASKNQAEAYIHLYTTTRNFPEDYNSGKEIPVLWSDVSVIGFSASPVLQDLGFASENPTETIHEVEALLLPRARDIRITVRALCHNELNYFGADKFRYGKASSFFARKEARTEQEIFKATGAAQRLKAIYLQPEAELLQEANILQHNLLRDNRKTDVELVQRIAAVTELESRGFSLVPKAGRRVQFGCSRNIRNSIAPDGMSITFSTKADLTNQWILPVQLILDRDWTWDALEPVAVEIWRKKWFREGEKPAEFALVGDVELKKIVSISATKNPDRSQTWLVFFDAVDPKPPIGNFPDIIELEYSIRPKFRAGIENFENTSLSLAISLPVTTNPVQIPRLSSAGIALSKYKRDPLYRNSEARARYLWLEFEEKVLDKHDALFVRVLNYAPDPLLSDWRWELFLVGAEPPLPIDPEEIRTVVPAQSQDNSGLDAMQEAVAVSDEGRHFIIPLPPGMHPDSPELFGFFTYEIRVGHKQIWSTAQGRFGRPLRTTGVQHPAPALYATVFRDAKKISVSAPLAKAVNSGKNVTARPPRTQVWALLYAQVCQADGKDFRNILLDDRLMKLPEPEKIRLINEDAGQIVQGGWTNQEIRMLLGARSLPPESSLSVLCVEMLPVVFSMLERRAKRSTVRRGANIEDLIMSHLQARYGSGAQDDNSWQETAAYNDAAGNYLRPLSDQLGNFRILRTSPLVEVPEVCCVDCD